MTPVIVTDIQQGTPEWRAARAGIATASEFAKLLTSTGKPSTQATTYMHKLLADWLIGEPSGPEATDWMLRGIEMEAEARAWYEMQTDADVQQVGIVYRDESRMVACSPDGLVGDEGGVEIKCPAPHTHVGYLLAGKLPSDYVGQVQGSMYVTGRAWWHFVSYHPDIDPLLIRVERDEAYIESLDKAVRAFVARLLEAREELTRRGVRRADA